MVFHYHVEELEYTRQQLSSAQVLSLPILLHHSLLQELNPELQGYYRHQIHKNPVIHELPFQQVPAFLRHQPYLLYSGKQRFSGHLPGEQEGYVHVFVALDHPLQQQPELHHPSVPHRLPYS